MKKKFLKCILCVTILGSLLCGCSDGTPVEVKEHQHFTTETCRRMISLYEFNVITYERYKDSDDSIEQSLADDAKLSANQIAEIYNTYVIKNKSLLENVYEEIYEELEVVK